MESVDAGSGDFHVRCRMIIDVHTHPPSHRDEVPEYERKINYSMRSGSGTPLSLTNSVAEYLQAMEVVDRAILFPIAPSPAKPGWSLLDMSGWPEVMNHNDIVAEVAKQAPDRIIPFMSVHPLDPNVDDEYDRAVGDLGCRGAKLGPPYQFFDPMCDEAFKFYRRLERDGLPVMFHQGTTPIWDAPLEYGHPFVIDRIAMAFPKLKMMIAHIAHPWHIDAINVVRKHPNVWTEVSAGCLRPWTFWNALRLAHEWGVMDKVFLGSDWPIVSPKETIDGLRSVSKFARDHHLPGVPEEETEAIINRDALDILGLD
jgi:hypothetical protein